MSFEVQDNLIYGIRPNLNNDQLSKIYKLTRQGCTTSRTQHHLETWYKLTG